MLIIETGQIVDGAESFATAAELVTYAANFGRTIPADTAAQESLLRRAALQMSAMNWKGGLVSELQALSWPRVDVYRENWLVPSNAIPAQIKAGQMALATEVYADDLEPPEQKTGPVTEERVEGAVDVKYGSPSPCISRPAATRQSYAQFGPFLEASNQVKMVRG